MGSGGVQNGVVLGPAVGVAELSQCRSVVGDVDVPDAVGVYPVGHDCAASAVEHEALDGAVLRFDADADMDAEGLVSAAVSSSRMRSGIHDPLTASGGMQNARIGGVAELPMASATRSR